MSWASNDERPKVQFRKPPRDDLASALVIVLAIVASVVALLGSIAYWPLFPLGIVWVVSVWAAAGVTANRGRGPTLGALLAFFLSLVGLIIAWLIPANQLAVRRRQLEIERQLDAEQISRERVVAGGAGYCLDCGKQHLVPYYHKRGGPRVCPFCVSPNLEAK